MSYNCFSIANCIIDVYKKKKEKDITILELLKHQFFCYGWYWAMFNKELFDGTFIAYPLGPIVDELYGGFDNSYQNGFFIKRKHDLGNDEEVSESVKKFISEIMDKYMKYLPIELSDITHLTDSPWEETVRNQGLRAEISSNLIKEYYKRLLQEKSLC